MDLSNANRIIIIRLSSLGDILLTTPLIRSIKKNFENIKIDFLLREEYKDTLSYNPYINKSYFYQRNDNSKVFESLSSSKYDLCIDLQNNLRSSKFASLLNCSKVKFQKHTIDKFLLVNFKINRLRGLPPIPVRYASSLKGFQLDDEGLDLFLPEGLKTSVKKQGNTIGFCPGSRHLTKMWPEEYFIELGNMLVSEGFNIALLGGKSDREVCKRISEKIPLSVDLSNNDDLLGIASEMKNCKLIVCNDSGMLHTACAVKTPVAVFFGSTVGEFGFIPYNNRNLILQNNCLSCRPCSHIGREKCPKGHFKCMLEVTPQKALNEILGMLK
ncbi:MAG: glycosyltransferase family 9 protein [Bacteroidota bacterium]|nr:glycosyltransferase family 9 protein [Bacteroidota bacterium]